MTTIEPAEKLNNCQIASTGKHVATTTKIWSIDWDGCMEQEYGSFSNALCQEAIERMNCNCISL